MENNGTHRGAETGEYSEKVVVEITGRDHRRRDGIAEAPEHQQYHHAGEETIKAAVKAGSGLVIPYTPNC